MHTIFNNLFMSGKIDALYSKRASRILLKTTSNPIRSSFYDFISAIALFEYTKGV